MTPREHLIELAERWEARASEPIHVIAVPVPGSPGCLMAQASKAQDQVELETLMAKTLRAVAGMIEA